jgi:uncharacterized cupin superfamily protein
MQRANIFHAEFEYDDTDPEPFRSGMTNVGRAAGGVDLAVKLFELPPGKHLCPYHYEYEEEWLIVLEGSVRVRTPEGEHGLAAGDVVRFDKGPDGAHRVTAGPDTTARVLMFSSAREPAVSVYPDSDKIGVWSGNPADEVLLRRSDGNRDYWDGESD